MSSGERSSDDSESEEVATAACGDVTPSDSSSSSSDDVSSSWSLASPGAPPRWLDAVVTARAIGLDDVGIDASAVDEFGVSTMCESVDRSMDQ